jgi:hypothetical protein
VKDPKRAQIECQGKQKHSATKAFQIAKSMRRRDGERNASAYHCKSCGAWHVGSHPHRGQGRPQREH